MKIPQFRVRCLILTGIIVSLSFWITPVRSQESEKKSEPTVLDKSVTTEDLTIPVEDLKLLVKPLTIDELQIESDAWLLILKNKVKQISFSEIAINKQNRSIDKEKEAVSDLEQAQKALLEAEEAQKNAEPGSSEYEEAAKKIEEAKEKLKEAQESVGEAIETKKEFEEDKNLTSAVERAEEEQKIVQAKGILEEAKKKRDSVTAGSEIYEAMTKKIDTLDSAIIAVETAQENLKSASPESEDYVKLSQELAKAKAELTKAIEAIEGKTLTEKEEDIQGEQIEKTAEKLEENAEKTDELKKQLLATVTELQGERTAIIDRFTVVLDEFETKGGDPESYKNYIEAVSTITFDIQDTEGLGIRIISWLKSEEGGLRLLLNLGKFVAVVVLVEIGARFLSVIVSKALGKISGVSNLFSDFIIVVINRSGLVLGVILGLAVVGLNLGPLLALIGGASFILAFALQSNLGNFASGLMLMINKPFDVGDEVKVAGYWAYVDSITLANTKLKAFNGSMVNLPNNTVWGGEIINYTISDIRKQMFSIYIKFDQDMNQVYEMWMEITSSHPKVLKEPAPGWFPWNSHFDYYISVSLSAWTTTDEYWGVYVDLLKELQKRIGELNIQLAAPIQDIRIQGSSGIKNNKQGEIVETLTEKSTKEYN